MCLLLRSSSFWFERLVEWARLDEGLDFYHGSLQQMQICWRCWWLLSCLGEQWGPSYRVCCALSLLISKGCISFEILRTSLYQSRIKSDTDTHTWTHTTHPFPSRCGRTQLRTKNLNTRILSNVHTVMHMPRFQLRPDCWKPFKLVACHVSHTLTVICKCPLMAERTVYFFLNKWSHTHTV